MKPMESQEGMLSQDDRGSQSKMIWCWSKSDADSIEGQWKEFGSDKEMAAEDPAGVCFLLESLIDIVVFILKSSL
jgi:hypothetical protein